MPETLALDALERLIASGVSTKTVARVDWARFKAIHETRTLQPFLERVGRLVATNAADLLPDRPSGLLASLEFASPEERRTRVTAEVHREVCSILGLDVNAPLDFTRGFVQMGFDSLMAIELRNGLQRTLGRMLPSPVVFNYPSIRALGAYLADVPSAIPGRSRNAADPPSMRALREDEVQSMSEEEAEAQLAARMATLDLDGVG
jgi:epothilone polyketide synthase D